ncbi:hypothetical protein G6O67_004278 [Ophiocordyceps sinensis]|uniref:Uncharacterized protein n=1 Tax=Ophiocordyceps sinensis TaxID=72228 RepID=A0A8H4PMP6_9HYPO|nr:hypothetical protein G6O67_004278 [Ophiocordyceps sinensis]
MAPSLSFSPPQTSPSPQERPKSENPLFPAAAAMIPVIIGAIGTNMSGFQFLGSYSWQVNGSISYKVPGSAPVWQQDIQVPI